MLDPTPNVTTPPIPSPQPGSRLKPREWGRRLARSVFHSLVLVLLLPWALACASGDASEPSRERRPSAPNAYLLHPADGWTGPLDDAQRQALDGGFAALSRQEDAVAALAASDAVLAQAPDFPPALVLAAQAELIRGAPADARKLLEGWIEQYPTYRAARLLWARVLDLGGEVAEAHAEYRALAADLPIATDRARATREPAVAAAQKALADALTGGRLDEAKQWADRIAEWESPTSIAALEAKLAVARAAGDEPGELVVLRSLHAGGRDEPNLRQRLADLELEHGDGDQALHLYEGLVAEFPEDEALRSHLGAAQLRFRLRLLPEEVQKLAARPELSRGDYAALLYWVVPGVRTQAQGGSARIASDVIDHRWQQEIIRVVNHRLLRVDSTMHRFEPDRPITRAEALESALEVAASRPGGKCAEAVASSRSPASTLVCETATRCAILADAAECLPQAKLSGGEALGILGRALSLQKTE